jgi:hypothetical protein
MAIWQGFFIKTREDTPDLTEVIVQQLTAIEGRGIVSDVHTIPREGGIHVIYRFQAAKPQLGKVIRSDEIVAGGVPDRTCDQGVSNTRTHY